MRASTAAAPDALHGLVSRGEALAAAQVPVFRSAAGGRFRLHLLPNSWSRFADDHGEHLPQLVMVGDIAVTQPSQGPKRWACTADLRRWRPHVAFVFAADPIPSDYLCIEQVAAQVTRVVVIETSARHAEAWGDAVRAMRTFIVRGTTH